MKPLHVLVIAGEVSGDKHGAKLISRLKKHEAVTVTAVGGSRMKEAADRFEEDIVTSAALGFVEIVRLIPYLVRLKNRLADKYFRKDCVKRIDALVVIDYPGFNVRIAKIAAGYGIPVFYYITPQVWAWGKKRVDLLAGICRKLYCMFSFEKELFEAKGGSVEVVGHPILEDIPGEFDIEGFNRRNNLKDGEKVLALLPGSRVNEIKKHLPVIIPALEGTGYKVMLGRAETVSEELIREYIPADVRVTSDVYTLLKRADLVVVSSGTSTLETAVIGTPFIAVYRVSAVSYMIAKLLVDIPYVCMVNILAGKEAVPELIQDRFKPAQLAQQIGRITGSVEVRDAIKKDLREVSLKIGTPGASARTADSIVKELRGGT
ncbi:MAG: lipid-A-disaccharide synthase [Elusimicrobia bacterium]|nr:lipid-A-disaccharide synthase [Elusimicrobiota bacterium]